MWKSKYRCFVIGSRYVYTEDNDLTKVYLSVKKACQWPNADNGFGMLLKEVIDHLDTFARHRGLVDQNLYVSVRKTLTLGFDTYQLSDEDFEIVGETLIDCIYKFQELEDVANRVSPLLVANDDAEGYDPRMSCREIRVRATHFTRDMSIGNTYYVDYYADIDQFDNPKDKCITLEPLDGGCVELVSVTKDAVALKWGEDEFLVKLGSDVTTKDYMVDNPRLSSDSLKLTFCYRCVPNYADLWSMIANLGCDEQGGKEDDHLLAARKEDILHFIDKTIERGNTGLYVAKALLNESNNWGTCQINCLNLFRQQLLKGIECGCLAPDNHYGWEWMEVASKYNDPTDFMEDMELYYDLLDSAVSHGVVEAIDIMDSIWEPEQIIEED